MADGDGVLEEGDVFFLYEPKVQEPDEQVEVGGLDDVERLLMVLRSKGEKLFRVVVVGPKRLPDNKRGGDNAWCFVEAVTDDAKKLEQALRADTYDTKTRGERLQPAARPVGEGVYAIARAGDKPSDGTRFAYALELPEEPGEAQKGLRIPAEAAFVLSVKNPEKDQPAGTGLDEERKADYPKDLQETFRDRRFAPADPVSLLDHEGTEFLLVSTGKTPEEDSAEVGLDPQDEDYGSADIVKKLRMAKSRHPVHPLFEGDWS